MTEQIEKIILNLLKKATHLWYYNRDTDKARYTIGNVIVYFKVTK